MVSKFFDKTSAANANTFADRDVKQNQQLADELHKMIIKKC